MYTLHCVELCSISPSAIPQFSLPTPCTDEDANMLLRMKYHKSIELRLFKSIVVTKQFLQSCLDVFGALIQEKAKKVCTMYMYNQKTSMKVFHCLFLRLLRSIPKWLLAWAMGRKALAVVARRELKDEVGGRNKGSSKVVISMMMAVKASGTFSSWVWQRYKIIAL